MKHKLSVIFLILPLFFSCSKNAEKEYDYIAFNGEEIRRLAMDIEYTNYQIIEFLDSSRNSEKLLIRGVREKSLKKIGDLKNELINYCGGRDQRTYQLKNPLERKKVIDFLINTDKGVELKKSINEITSFIKKYDESIRNLAMDANDFPDTNDNEIFKNQTFAELHFSNSTLLGALNTIQIYEGFILQIENDFLSKILIEEVSNCL